MIASLGLAVIRAAAGQETTCFRMGLRFEAESTGQYFWSQSPISAKGPEVRLLTFCPLLVKSSSLMRKA